MNSNSLGKARTRVVNKLVFLFVFALVALAYVVTPVFACGGNNNGNGNNNGSGNAAAAGVRQQQKKNRANNNNNGGGNGVAAATRQQRKNRANNNNNNGNGNDSNKNDNDNNGNGNNGNGNGNGNGISASTNQQALDDLKNGLNETFTNSSAATVTLKDITPGKQFKINFSDGISLNATLTNTKKATVTLPDGTTITVQVDVANDKVILSNKPTALTNSDKQTITLLRKNSLAGNLQLFTNGPTPIELSALQRVGQKFKIKMEGTLLNAVFLGNNQALVTLLSGKRTTIQLG